MCVLGSRTAALKNGDMRAGPDSTVSVQWLGRASRFFEHCFLSYADHASPKGAVRHGSSSGRDGENPT